MTLSRRTFVKVAGVSAATLAMGGLVACSGGEDKKEAPADAPRPDAGPQEEAFMSQGKGEHLTCAVTGKLIKIAPAIIAQQKGFFAEEECDVEFQTIALADAMAAMSVNRLDIDLFGVVPACSYVSQGAEIYVFGGTILNGSEMLSTEAFDRELKTADDFRGLRINCSREETGQMALKNYLQENGLTLGEDVFFEYVDNNTTAMEGLRSDQCDLFITNNAMGYSLGVDGIKVAGIVRDVTGDYPCCRQNCSAEAYTSKYLSLVDFEVAILRGYDFYLNNKDEVIQMLCDYSSQEPDYVEAAMYGTDTYRNVMNLSPDPHTKDVKAFYKALQNINEIEPDSPYDMEPYAMYGTDTYRNVMNLSPDPHTKDVKAFYKALQNINEIEPDSPYDMEPYAVSGIYRKALDILLDREPDNETYKQLDADFSKYND